MMMWLQGEKKINCRPLAFDGRTFCDDDEDDDEDERAHDRACVRAHRAGADRPYGCSIMRSRP